MEGQFFCYILVASWLGSLQDKPNYIYIATNLGSQKTRIVRLYQRILSEKVSFAEPGLMPGQPQIPERLKFYEHIFGNKYLVFLLTYCRRSFHPWKN